MNCVLRPFAPSNLDTLSQFAEQLNVRRETGEQAKILNYMMEHWAQMKPEELFDRALKELIGHTPLQVFMGALLGIAVGWGGGWLFTR